MRDPKLTFLIRCAYGAVWLALIWLMVRYVLVWLLPFLIALALAALLEPAVVLCRRRLHLRRGFTATVLSLVVVPSVFIRTMYRKRCLRHLALPKKKRTNSLASSSMHSSMVFRHMQVLHMVWIV